MQSALSLLPWACAVCFGDPNSLFSKGALAGVLTLLLVILAVLSGIAWTAFTWARRARILEKSANGHLS